MSVILLYNSPIKSSNIVQCGEFFIAKKKLGLVPTFSLEETKFLKRKSVDSCYLTTILIFLQVHFEILRFILSGWNPTYLLKRQPRYFIKNFLSTLSNKVICWMCLLFCNFSYLPNIIGIFRFW